MDTPSMLLPNHTLDRSSQAVNTLLIAIVLAMGACGKGEVSGELRAKGNTLGDWTMKGGTCFSGHREEFFGVNAVGSKGSGTRVKLVKDQIRGWTAVVNIPSTCKEGRSCKGIVLSASDCSEFAVDVRRTGSTVNDVREVEGSWKVKCSLQDGTLSGTLSFESCR